jgi:hypothetical protein
MLRRDFLSLIASFTAASTAVRVAAAAANVPADQAVCGVDLAAPGGALAEALDQRSQFERTVIDCLRDKSLRCLGVETSGSGFDATFVPHAGYEPPIERRRIEGVLELYDRGVVYVSSVTVLNNYSGVRVFFGICA